MNNRNNFDQNQNQNMGNMNMNQMPVQAQQPNSAENDSTRIDELAGVIYQIIEEKYPK